MNILRKSFVLAPLIVIVLFYLHGSFARQLNKEQIIEGIMNYQMSAIINRCKKDFNYTDDDMKILEQEFKRFMVLSVLTKEDSVGMFSRDVDNLWHTFILFTNEYADFCNQYNGKFIHHLPEIEEHKTPEKVAEMRGDFQAFIKNYEAIFKEEVHPIWFLDMCEDA